MIKAQFKKGGLTVNRPKESDDFDYNAANVICMVEEDIGEETFTVKRKVGGAQPFQAVGGIWGFIGILAACILVVVLIIVVIVIIVVVIVVIVKKRG